MDKIAPQIERLNRHFQHSIETYDLVSLLDLAHTMRIWVELKKHLSENYPAFASEKLFYNATTQRRIINHTKNERYIYVYMPKNGVEVKVGGTVNTEFNTGLFGVSADDIFFGHHATYTGNSFIVRDFCCVSCKLDQKDISALGKPTLDKVNFSSWLTGDAASIRFKNLEGKLIKQTISRENMIKRVANGYDASHSSLGEDVNTNIFDDAIDWMMQIKYMGIPLPQFILLHIAHEILEHRNLISNKILK